LVEAPHPAQVALKGRCPRCGGGPLFSGVLKLAPACTVCGLDYGRFNVGDGAAAGVILLVGAIIMPLSLVVDFRFNPPWWVHMLLWVPAVVGLSLALLRLSKGLLVAMEYRHDAGEGQRTDQ
jgi:uncharacterized protein (DUF983 family)